QPSSSLRSGHRHPSNLSRTPQTNLAQSAPPKPTPATQTPTASRPGESKPSGSPTIVSTPPAQASPSPQSTPFAVPSLPGPSPASTASPIAPPSITGLPAAQQTQPAPLLSLDEALRLANGVASAFQQASLNERIAA